MSKALAKFKGSKARKYLMSAAALCLALACAAFPMLSAFATGEDTSGTGGGVDATMLGQIDDAFQGVKTDVLAIIGKALPVALAIMGIGLAITLGLKFFKKASK